MVVRCKFRLRAAFDQLPKMLIPFFKPGRRHPLGRLDRLNRILGKRKNKRSVFRTKKSGGVKSLEFFFFSNSLQSLTNVNKSRDGRVVGS